ncbi:MAG: hypothetical protein V3V18_02445 [Methylococcales bacterium]
MSLEAALGSDSIDFICRRNQERTEKLIKPLKNINTHALIIRTGVVMNTGVERPIMRGNTNKKVKTRLKPANRCEKQHSVNFNILLKIVISLNPLHDDDINPWFDCPVTPHLPLNCI